MNILKFEEHGRILCCKFKCMRCGAEEIREAKKCIPGDEGDRFLHNWNPPKGWSDHFYGRLLCPQCTEGLKNFLDGGDGQ